MCREADAGSLSITPSRATSAGLWLCSLAFLFAFAVKVPIFPLHGWLKDAIAEAPTAAVMVLAGKTGLYSILRFSFGIFPEQSHRIAPLMVALGAIGIVYGALIAITRNRHEGACSVLYARRTCRSSRSASSPSPSPGSTAASTRF